MKTFRIPSNSSSLVGGEKRRRLWSFLAYLFALAAAFICSSTHVHAQATARAEIFNELGGCPLTSESAVPSGSTVAQVANTVSLSGGYFLEGFGTSNVGVIGALANAGGSGFHNTTSGGIRAEGGGAWVESINVVWRERFPIPQLHTLRLSFKVDADVHLFASRTDSDGFNLAVGSARMDYSVQFHNAALAGTKTLEAGHALTTTGDEGPILSASTDLTPIAASNGTYTFGPINLAMSGNATALMQNKFVSIDIPRSAAAIADFRAQLRWQGIVEARAFDNAGNELILPDDFEVGVIGSHTAFNYWNAAPTPTPTLTPTPDADADGFPDAGDNCPWVWNPSQIDTDLDGSGDDCDPTPTGDTDNDGVDNALDNCPAAHNPDQADIDADGVGNACDSTPAGDTDSDGVDNAIDNCPTIANPDQVDADADGIGDACDPAPMGNTPIVYSSNRDGNHEIYTMASDGTEVVRITNHTAADDEPVWSPDRLKIAFTTRRDGNSEIYTMNADGGDLRRLTDHAAFDFNPAWSPDGARIAFASTRDGNLDIYTMNDSGGDLRRITEYTGWDWDPEWSPDGGKIAFTRKRNGNIDIYSTDAGGGAAATRLTHHSKKDINPSWSPDGSRIAYSRKGKIYSMRAADGHDVRKLTKDSGTDANPAWSPDGLEIVFTSTRHGNPEILKMKGSDGSGVIRLTNTPGKNIAPDW